MPSPNPKSCIFVCKNQEIAKEHILNRYAHLRIVPFVSEKEFSIEDAKAVLKEAYIAEEQTKILMLCANAYNIYSQNALLKILEEPPHNIVFVLITTSKMGLLPTIRSRMTTVELHVEEELQKSGLCLDRLDVGMIYTFTKENAKLSKQELKSMIQCIVQEAIKEFELSFSHKELEYFGKLVELCELNVRPQNLLTSLLMSIMLRKNR
ncbi:MAG: DNA polymerase III subunit delta' [Sulfurospirillum sp.]|nr:DNA polymerase III subunit delta' [Sulfurospirillum sp.]